MRNQRRKVLLMVFEFLKKVHFDLIPSQVESSDNHGVNLTHNNFV